MNTKKKLNILLVENNPSDVKLILNILKIDFEPVLSVVQNEKDFRKELKNMVPDLIISDFSLPQFDGRTALKIRNNKFPSVPFILVTGSLNEEMAAEIMKAGADDYVIKEHLDRLNSAVTSSLEKIGVLNKNREMLEKLKESEETFQNIFNNSSVAIYIQEKDGTFIDVNKAAVKLYGYNKEYLVGKTPEIVNAPGKNDLKEIGGYIEKAFNGTPQQFEFWAKRKNGEIFPKIITLEKGRYFGRDVVFAYAIDISARKRAEIIESIQHNIAKELLSAKDLKSLLGKVKEELGRLIDTNNFIVALYNRDKKTISVPFETDEVDEIPQEIPADVTITGYTIKKKQPVFLYKEEIEELIKRGETTVKGTVPEIWIGVPMILKKRVFGVIIVQSYRDRNTYSLKDLEVIKLVAYLLSLFIEKIKANEELEKHHEHLEELVKERTSELEERNKELERYHKLFIEREFRIKELRDQVKEFKSRLGIKEEN